MSLKKKMEDLLEAYPGYGKNRESEAPAQGSSKKPDVQVLEKGSGGGKTIRKGQGESGVGVGPKVGAFEAGPAKQGSSKDAPIVDLGKNPGGPAFKKALPKAGIAMKGPIGKAPGYTTVADPTSEINKSSSKGNVMRGEETETDEELVETTEEETELEEKFEKGDKKEKKDDDDDDEDDDEDDEDKKDKDDKKAKFTKMKKEELEQDVANLFTEDVDLSEEFKSKAASLFEAAVVARVAHEVSLIEDAVAEKAVQIIAEKEMALVEKIDEYMSYAAEEWVKTNEVAVSNMLRTEIAENFMKSLRTCFVENYIDVPDEKYDVLGEMQEAIDTLQAERDEVINDATELAEELLAMKRNLVVTQVTEGMAKTQIEKFNSLVEEVTYEDDKSFAEKLEIVKKNLFSGTPSTVQNVIEEVDGSEPNISEAFDPEIAALNAKISGKMRF
jgi:hypothetical protein